MAEVIEEFFVPIKKIKRGEVVIKKTEEPKKKSTAPITTENPKIQAWMRKNSPRRVR